ncbi:hypothetical protein JCM10914A_02000 [Paenibacillus sp. JCM 10914]
MSLHKYDLSSKSVKYVLLYKSHFMDVSKSMYQENSGAPRPGKSKCTAIYGIRLSSTKG